MTGSVDNSGLLNGIVPSPPKTTGNTEKDLAALANWVWQLYQVVQLQQTFVTNSSQGASSFSPPTLPNPATSNIATAQDTANQGYTSAATALTTATAAQTVAGNALTNAATAQATADTANNRTKDWEHGSFTISGATTSQDVTLPSSQADTSYFVIPGEVGTSGTPAAGSTIISGIVNATNKFTVTLTAAPGVGNSVTFNWILVR